MEEDEVALDERAVCANCVANPHLRNRIGALGRQAPCYYCGQGGACVDLGILADIVAVAFEDHFVLTARDPDSFEQAMLKDPEGSYAWERTGDPVCEVIADNAGVSEALAADIREWLYELNDDWDAALCGWENPFDPDACYSQMPPDDEALHRDWIAFETSLKAESRFFNKRAMELLQAVFGSAVGARTVSGEPVVRSLGQGEAIDHLFRARVFQSHGKLTHALAHPVEELGPPPMALARAGRMNAAGVAVFYGALDPSTAVGEIRPPTRSRVVVAQFQILRPLRLLDVERLRTIFVEGSMFDPAYAERLRHAKFLESVSARIARPVMPDDEPFDYLPTQAIADFLASAEGPGLDGMIYPSAQVGNGGRNVVLFHKAARVAPLDLPPDAAIRADVGGWDGDEWLYDYRVRVELPPADGGSPSRRMPSRMPSDADRRRAALRLNTSTMQVHEVLPQEVRTDEAKVSWTVSGPRREA